MNELFDLTNARVFGHVLIRDRDTEEVLVNKRNAIHFENFSIALAKSLAHKPDGNIHSMFFGNGGSSVSGSGQITYLPPRTTGLTANLYNPTFFKVVDDESPLNINPDNNNIVIKHTTNTLFTDIIITATLEFGEPVGQSAFDDATDTEGQFVFDEIGIKTFNADAEQGSLLTHVIFHPIQKSLNRIIQIIYTIRIAMC